MNEEKFYCVDCGARVEKYVAQCPNCRRQA